MCKVVLTVEKNTAASMQKAMVNFLEVSIESMRREIEGLEAPKYEGPPSWEIKEKRSYLLALRNMRQSLSCAEIKIIEGELS